MCRLQALPRHRLCCPCSWLRCLHAQPNVSSASLTALCRCGPSSCQMQLSAWRPHRCTSGWVGRWVGASHSVGVQRQLVRLASRRHRLAGGPMPPLQTPAPGVAWPCHAHSACPRCCRFRSSLLSADQLSAGRDRGAHRPGEVAVGGGRIWWTFGGSTNRGAASWSTHLPFGGTPHSGATLRLAGLAPTSSPPPLTLSGEDRVCGPEAGARWRGLGVSRPVPMAQQ